MIRIGLLWAKEPASRVNANDIVGNSIIIMNCRAENVIVNELWSRTAVQLCRAVTCKLYRDLCSSLSVDCCAVACSDFREFAATVDSGPHTFYIICFYIRALSLLP